MKQSGDSTCQWINPQEHLSYQVPQKPFEIFEEDFRKTALDYLMFQKKMDAKLFSEDLLNKVLYSSKVMSNADNITILLEKGSVQNGKN